MFFSRGVADGSGVSKRNARLQLALCGLLFGALAGFFGVEFGLGDLLGFHLDNPTIVLDAALLGGILAVAAGRRGTFVLAILDVLLLILHVAIANTGWMGSVARRWVRQDQWASRPDAVIVLSSSVLGDSALDQYALSRMLTGIGIVERDSIPRLVTSRVEVSYGDNTVSSDVDQRRLVALTHMAARWDIIDSVSSTHDEALRSAHLLLPVGARSIVVVTTPMHTRRACATFEHVGFTVYCQPALEHTHDTWHPRSSADRIPAFRDYVYERLGIIEYRWKGWIGKPNGGTASSAD